MTNDNSMTINNIIDFIKDKKYIDNNNHISLFNYNFKGSYNEYCNIGNIYMNIFKDKFENIIIINDLEILIKYDNLTFNVNINNDNDNDNDNIYWYIVISYNDII